MWISIIIGSMAMIRFHNGQERSVSPEQGRVMWEILKGQREPTDEKQAQYVANVRRIFLNWHNAPDDYIKEHLETIIPMALSSWIVDPRGRPIKPQSDFDWKFAKRWGLWEHGRATSLVVGGQLKGDLYVGNPSGR